MTGLGCDNKLGFTTFQNSLQILYQILFNLISIYTVYNIQSFPLALFQYNHSHSTLLAFNNIILSYVVVFRVARSPTL